MEIVNGVINSVVRNPALGKIVGTDFGRTVAGTYERFASRGYIVDILLMFFIVNKCTQTAECTLFVFGWSRVSVHSIRISSVWPETGLRHIYRRRTPDSTLLTFCPPAPPERNVSHLISPSLISTSKYLPPEEQQPSRQKYALAPGSPWRAHAALYARRSHTSTCHRLRRRKQQKRFL